MYSAVTTNCLSSHTHEVSSFLEKYNTGSDQISLNGNKLCISDIHSVFTKKFSSASVTKEAREAIENSYKFLEQKIAQGACVYGVNTGFGGSADVRSDKDQTVQKNLVTLLNAGFGEKLPLLHVKATMVARVNSICRGYSGVHGNVVDLLVQLINNDIVPYVPKRGSISASGDLMPSSYIAACLEGRSTCQVRANGKDTVASLALAEANLSPVVFKGKDALGVINASSFAATLAAEILYKGNVAILLTQAVVAMTAEALRGSLESFHPVIHDMCLPHPGQREVARNIRNFLDGTKFAITHQEDESVFREGKLRQDRYGLRTSPQWLGPTLETALESIRRIETELNSSNDNPIVDPRMKLILHGGNFQGTSTTIAMDQFRQGMQICGKLLFALMSEIVDCTINNGLTPNLCGGDPNVDMGFKGAEIAMASYTSELDYLTNPVSNHVLSAELRNQSVNSLALISARLSESALEIFQMQLANIMCALAQAIDLRWMKNRVESIVASLVRDVDSSVKRSMLMLIPWYKYIHHDLSTNGVAEVRKDIPGVDTADFDRKIQEQIHANVDKLMDDLKTGKLMHTVAQDLGNGTRLLYLFVRQTLSIKFYDGNYALDSNLQSIFDALKDGGLDDTALKLATVAQSNA